MAQFVVNDMQLYLGAEIQQLIILMGRVFIDVVVMEKY